MNIADIIYSCLGTVQVSLQAEDLLAFAKEIVAQINKQEQSSISTEGDELLTRKHVMEYLGIKSTTLWQWTKMGILNPIKIKRKCLYRKREILALQSKKSNINDNHKKKRDEQIYI